MALQKQTVSLNLSNGIDQKDDEFAGTANTFEDLVDWRFDKDLRMAKRYGTRVLSTTRNSSFPNALSIGSSNIASSSMVYKDQLLLQNKGVLYSHDEKDNEWNFKGHYYPISAEKQNLYISTNYEIIEQVRKSGRVFYTSKVSTLFNPFGSSSTYLEIDDEETGSKVASIEIDSAASNPKFLNFASRLFVLYGSGSNLVTKEIDLTANTLGSGVNVKTDLAGVFEVAYSLQSGTERYFVNYQSTGTNITVSAILNTGLLDSTLGSLTVAGQLALIPGTFSDTSTLGVYYSNQNASLYLSQSTVSTFTTTISVRIVTFTASAYTTVATLSVETGDSRIIGNGIYTRGFFSDDPNTAGQVLFVFEQPALKLKLVDANTVNTKIQYLSSTALVGSPFNFALGVGVASKGWTDTNRNTVYFFSQYFSPDGNNSILFLMDIFRGRSENSLPLAAPIGKFFEGSFGGSYFNLPDINSGQINYPINFRVQETTNNAFVLVSKNLSLNLLPSEAGNHIFAAESLATTGGFLGNYDGNVYSENNFFVAPDSVEVFNLTTASRVTLAKVAEGSGGTAEAYTITYPPGEALSGVNPSTNYAQFYYNATDFLRVAVRTGSGSVSGGTINVTVDILSTDSAYQVAVKVAQAVNVAISGISSFQQWSVSTGSTVSVTNLNFGAVTDASLVGYGVSARGSAETRSFIVVEEHIDANGQRFESSPTPAISFSGAGQSAGNSANWWVTARKPNVSHRRFQENVFHLYGTVSSGTTFYKVQRFANFQTRDVINVTADFGVSDTTNITSNELLYTTGGVEPNAPTLEACNAVSVYKNRVVVSGTDNNTLYYSKTMLNQEPINMAQTFFIQTANDSQRIVGHGELDDKLVVFKDQSVVAYAGDGANDVGANVSFSLPINVASDVGCLTSRSICLTPNGLWFQSKMGIQLLDRGLNVQYPGEQVKDFNAFQVTRGLVLRDDKIVREVRFLLQSSPTNLVFNYLRGKWARFSQYAGQDAVIWKEQYARVTSTGVVVVEDPSTFIDGTSEGSYSQFIKTTWLKLKNMQDYQRIYRLMFLGALKTAHTLQVKAYYDYDSTNFDTYTFLSSNITGAQPDDTVYEPEIHLKRQKCAAIQLEVTVIPTGTNTEECLNLTDLSFQVGVKAGLNKTKKAKKL